MAMAMPRQQKASEVAVGQQGRNHSALRGSPFRPSCFGGLHRPPADDFHHRRRKPALDGVKHMPVGDAPGQAAQQGGVRNRGEIVAQVRVYHLPPPMLRDVPINPSESHLGVQPGAETILLRQQVRLEDGTNDQHRRHLDCVFR